MPLTILTALPLKPFVFPQLQPCGRGVQTPKLPASTLDVVTVTVVVLVAVCDGEDESSAVSVRVYVPAEV